MFLRPAPTASTMGRPSPVELQTLLEGMESVTRVSYCLASWAFCA